MRAAVVALALLAGGPALAHSELRRTVPADGAVVSAAPERFEMVFNEPVQLTFLRLRDAAGAEAPLPPRRDIRPASSETVPLPALAPGLWRVDWRAISADGHPVGGVVRFTIRAAGGGR